MTLGRARIIDNGPHNWYTNGMDIRIKSLAMAALFSASAAYACIGLDDIGLVASGSAFYRFSTQPREGPAIPDSHWVAGVVIQGHAKCYHVNSFGLPHGVTDQLTNVFTAY